MYASDRRTGVLIGFGSDVQVSARLGSPIAAFGRREPTLHQLALDSSAIGLAGPAAEIFHKESFRHSEPRKFNLARHSAPFPQISRFPLEPSIIIVKPE